MNLSIIHIHISTVKIPAVKSMQTLVIDLIDAGWSQKEIAAASGLSPNSVSRIYQDKTRHPDWRGQKRLIELHDRVIGDK